MRFQRSTARSRTSRISVKVISSCAFLPFHGLRGRPVVEDGGDIGEGVVYASRPASAFWRFCSKKLAISPAMAVQSSASIARNSWAVMTGEEIRRTTL